MFVNCRLIHRLLFGCCRPKDLRSNRLSAQRRPRGLFHHEIRQWQIPPTSQPIPAWTFSEDKGICYVAVAERCRVEHGRVDVHDCAGCRGCVE